MKYRHLVTRGLLYTSFVALCSLLLMLPACTGEFDLRYVFPTITPTDEPPDVPLFAVAKVNGYLFSQPDALQGELIAAVPPNTELSIVFGPTKGPFAVNEVGDFYLVRVIGMALGGWIRATEINIR